MERIKIKNPKTGKWIFKDGSTAAALRKEGVSLRAIRCPHPPRTIPSTRPTSPGRRRHPMVSRHADSFWRPAARAAS